MSGKDPTVTRREDKFEEAPPIYYRLYINLCKTSGSRDLVSQLDCLDLPNWICLLLCNCGKVTHHVQAMRCQSRTFHLSVELMHRKKSDDLIASIYMGELLTI